MPSQLSQNKEELVYFKDYPNSPNAISIVAAFKPKRFHYEVSTPDESVINR